MSMTPRQAWQSHGSLASVGGEGGEGGDQERREVRRWKERRGKEGGREGRRERRREGGKEGRGGGKEGRREGGREGRRERRREGGKEGRREGGRENRLRVRLYNTVDYTAFIKHNNYSNNMISCTCTCVSGTYVAKSHNNVRYIYTNTLYLGQDIHREWAACVRGCAVKVMAFHPPPHIFIPDVST